MVRILKTATGFLLLALGVAMLVTPGSGWLAIAGGLALLATDHNWARKWLARVRTYGVGVVHRTREN